MPLPMLARLRNPTGCHPTCSATWRSRSSPAAVLFDEIDTANAITPIVAHHFPQHAAGWKAYQGAPSPQQKKLEAALLLLRLPPRARGSRPGWATPTCGITFGLYGPLVVA